MRLQPRRREHLIREQQVKPGGGSGLMFSAYSILFSITSVGRSTVWNRSAQVRRGIAVVQRQHLRVRQPHKVLLDALAVRSGIPRFPPIGVRITTGTRTWSLNMNLNFAA